MNIDRANDSAANLSLFMVNVAEVAPRLTVELPLHQKGGNMTALLEQALAAIEKLPADAQDAIATRLLAEVADEHAWAERFEATTDAQWDRIAASVRQAIATEDLVPLDDVFPPRVRP